MAESFFRPVMDLDLGPELTKKFLPKEACAKAVNPPLAEMAAQADAVKKRWVAEVKRAR